MGLCCTCGLNHDGKQKCQMSSCNSYSGMLMAGQYSVPDNGDSGVGEEGQGAWCQECKTSKYCYVRKAHAMNLHFPSNYNHMQ